MSPELPLAASAPSRPGERQSVLAAPWIRVIALLGLCAAYLQGGVDKALDFNGAVAEMQHFGLAPAALLVWVAIVLELGGSVLIIGGWYRWLAALALALFTLAATFIANRFWELPPSHDRFMTENGFFEHLGLVGGFLLVAWLDLQRAKPPAELACW
jgi:uncharacterized membrane protein YphA (DoxX/SURF4 family)